MEHGSLTSKNLTQKLKELIITTSVIKPPPHQQTQLNPTHNAIRSFANKRNTSSTWIKPQRH